MDNRWKFLYHRSIDTTEAVTQEDRQSGLMVEPVQAQRLVRSEVRAPIRLMCEGDRKMSREAADFTLARKAAREIDRCPYRKPTQVGEERILRRTGEPLLRNSAK
jgi:hypothetical protein